jgi:hypothetical protein
VVVVAADDTFFLSCSLVIHFSPRQQHQQHPQGYLICGFYNRIFYSIVLVALLNMNNNSSSSSNNNSNNNNNNNKSTRFDPYILVALLSLGTWFAVSTVKHKVTKDFVGQGLLSWFTRWRRWWMADGGERVVGQD